MVCEVKTEPVRKRARFFRKIEFRKGPFLEEASQWKCFCCESGMIWNLFYIQNI